MVNRMEYEYLTNVPLDQAVKAYLAFLEARGMTYRTETVPVQEALDRVTAQAVYARICAPHYNASAMDGVALDAALTFGATETTPVRLEPSQYVPVDTGDPLPDGCDAVVMIEDCVRDGDGIRFYQAAAPWQHVRQIGEDVSAGDMILPSFTPVEPAAAGALLAGGVWEVEVLKKPRVAILPTGDEIVPPGKTPARGEIIEFNSTIFSGLLRRYGAEPVTYPIVRDTYEAVAAMLARAASECDLVLLCAGTSAGRDDGTTTAIKRLGEVLYHGVAVKPGKPAVLGAIGAVPVIGVPGYPVSGIVVLETLAAPVIRRLLMRPEAPAENAQVRLGRRLNSSLKYREFVRATLSTDADGKLTATPLQRGAGVVTSFVKADCLLDVPQAREGYEAGETAEAQLLRPLSCIRNTLHVIGSHDPLIDEAADLLKRSDPGMAVSSAHVGSTGGILAVRRGEAQLAGIHLLNPADGVYNVSYIERYFPEGGAALIECVQRVQGFMVAQGNPKRIGGVSDLSRPDVSYVNRQRGAGTRVLLDYLLTQNGLTPDRIRDYAREEATHTAVAAQIAAGTADCGLGILSAARIYDLDFIPVCSEQYDLLAPVGALDDPRVRAFLDILGGEAFAARLRALGGYIVDRPGRIRKQWN